MDEETETKRKIACQDHIGNEAQAIGLLRVHGFDLYIPLSLSLFKIWGQLLSVPVMEVYSLRKEFLSLILTKNLPTAILGV